MNFAADRVPLIEKKGSAAQLNLSSRRTVTISHADESRRARLFGSPSIALHVLKARRSRPHNQGQPLHISRSSE